MINKPSKIIWAKSNHFFFLWHTSLAVGIQTGIVKKIVEVGLRILKIKPLPRGANRAGKII